MRRKWSCSLQTWRKKLLLDHCSLCKHTFLARRSSLMLLLPYVRKWVSICHSNVLLFTMILLPATKHSDIFHSLDIWHKSKKIRKALAKVRLPLFVKRDTNTCMRLQAGKVKNMNKLQQWSGNIINHFGNVVKHVKGILKS